MKHAAQHFQAVSSHGVMEGFVAAMDGLLVQTIVPSRYEVVGNVRAGHHHDYGLNL